MRRVKVTPLRVAIVAYLQRQGDDEQPARRPGGPGRIGIAIGVAQLPILLGIAERLGGGPVDAFAGDEPVAADDSVALQRGNDPPADKGLDRPVGRNAGAQRDVAIAAVQGEDVAHGALFRPSAWIEGGLRSASFWRRFNAAMNSSAPLLP